MDSGPIEIKPSHLLLIWVAPDIRDAIGKLIYDIIKLTHISSNSIFTKKGYILYFSCSIVKEKEPNYPCSRKTTYQLLWKKVLYTDR